MDRTIARALEAKKIAETIKVLFQQITPVVGVQKKYELPEAASGRDWSILREEPLDIGFR